MASSVNNNREQRIMKYVLKEIILSEVSLERMLSVHSDAGYIIITAFRGGDSDPTVLKQWALS